MVLFKMTQKEKTIYGCILKHQPICDKCISNKLGYKHNQNANTFCRKLRDDKYIIRTDKKICPLCNGKKYLNIIEK